jgi:hypothetical protein
MVRGERVFMEENLPDRGKVDIGETRNEKRETRREGGVGLD